MYIKSVVLIDFRSLGRQCKPFKLRPVHLTGQFMRRYLSEAIAHAGKILDVYIRMFTNLLPVCIPGKRHGKMALFEPVCWKISTLFARDDCPACRIPLSSIALSPLCILAAQLP